MNKQIIFVAIITLATGSTLIAQRPGGQPGRPGDGPPRAGQPGQPGDRGDRQRGPEGRPDGDWMKPHDANNNGNLEAEEFQAAIERTFTELDRNKNGVIDAGETSRPFEPQELRMPPPEGFRDGKRLLPPFFFQDRADQTISYTRQEFEKIVRGVFAEMDKNGDNTLIKDEARGLPKPTGEGRPHVEPPNARFIAAELRFGDRLVKGQPFSAEMVIEDTKRLFDGTTATKQTRGAIYRDGEGRTRREQPLEQVGGVSIVGPNNKPQMLIFINDFAAQSQIFLDSNNKVARRSPLGSGHGPLDQRPGSNEESLGTKTIEGITAEGTRVSFEIPAGQFGNDKPMKAVTERWFSKELQVIVMSRHLDPIAGEHVFKLVNIKRSEPSSDLFAVPTGYRVEGPGRKGNE